MQVAAAPVTSIKSFPPNFLSTGTLSRNSHHCLSNPFLLLPSVRTLVGLEITLKPSGNTIHCTICHYKGEVLLLLAPRSLCTPSAAYLPADNSSQMQTKPWPLSASQHLKLPVLTPCYISPTTSMLTSAATSPTSWSNTRPIMPRSYCRPYGSLRTDWCQTKL